MYHDPYVFGLDVGIRPNGLSETFSGPHGPGSSSRVFGVKVYRQFTDTQHHRISDELAWLLQLRYLRHTQSEKTAFLLVRRLKTSFRGSSHDEFIILSQQDTNAPKIDVKSRIPPGDHESAFLRR